MANSQTKGIEKLENTCKINGLDYTMTGKYYPANISSMTILGNSMTTSTWDNEDFFELSEAIEILIDMGITTKKLSKYLADYTESPSDVSGEYVKESYQNTHMSLANVLWQAVKGSAYAQSKFESVLNTRIDYTFKTTQSAFLYKGYYITPCILGSIIELVWRNCTDKQQKEYLNKFYNGQKQKLQTIIDDSIYGLFNNDLSKLTLLDDYRLTNLQARV